MDLSTSSSANLVADSRIDGFDFKLDLSIDESARQRKRPRCRTIRPLEDKIEAIDRVNNGETKAAVGKDMSVPESTLRGWCKSEPKIRAMTRNTLTPDSEASSSGSSMDTHNAAANHLSDDDGPARKRIKIEPQYPSMVENTRSKGYNNYSNLFSSFLQQQHLHTMTQTNDVRLVKNGLEYTKSGINPAVKKMHSISAIAPMQMDSVAKSVPKMSLPPAAEAPAIPVPASPNLQVPIANKKNGVFRPLQQQKEFNGQQSNEQTVQLGKKRWFWQWCNQGGCMVPTISTMQNSSTSMSPQKAMEIVDNELESQEGPDTLEEAILHGDKFLQWFNKCPQPSLTCLQLLQFKYLLDTLKSQTKKKPSPGVKRSRK